jgi:hypothetical protein
MNDFELFWQAYPKKKAKRDAFKAWQQTEGERPSTDELLKIVRLTCKTEEWMKAGGQFIPLPATYLRGWRWEDELEVKISGVVNDKPWHETASGIEAKGAEYGLRLQDFESFPAFRQAVMHKAMREAA